MREILFRGKRLDNSEWIYGDLRQYSERSKGICERELSRTMKVIPESVGQYTGLKDKNGKKIFEGDIIAENDVLYKDEIQIQGEKYGVSFQKGCWMMIKNENDWDFLYTNCESVIVIGNIHDNPNC